MEKQSHFIWSVKVSDKGQISIPKQAREVFHIQTGDTLILLGDTSRGLAIAKYEDYLQFANAVFAAKQKNDKENNDD